MKRACTNMTPKVMTNSEHYVSFLKIKIKHMKNLLIAIIALVTLGSCTQQKIAYVDSEELMKEYHVMKTYEKELKTQEEAFQTKYKQQMDAIQAEYQEFQQKASKMKRKNAEARNVEINQKYQQLQQMQQSESYQLQQESQQKMSTILKEVTDFVKDYGQKNGYTYILGTTVLSGNVLYGEEKLNITEVVLDALNVDTKSETKPEKNEVKKDSIK